MNTYCNIIFILFFSFLSLSLAANCYGPGTSKIVINEFDAFPSPVSPGKNLYIRANIQQDYEIKSGTVQIAVYYSDKVDITGLNPVVNFVGMDLCSLSSKVSCPIKNGSSTFEWEFPVPDILPGTYQVRYTIIETNPADGNAYSCIQFPITVEGEKKDSYKSWYQATLLGVAVFDVESYSERQLGHSVQVGPSGPLNATAPGYGSIKGLKGSGELVPNPYYDTSNFIWGMKGTLVNLIRGAKGKATHVYQGTFYMGYQSPFFPFSYTEENPLVSGIFNITWVYSASETAQVSGFIMFDSVAEIPPHWGSPLTFGRIARHDVVTSDEGFLLIKGSDTYCPAGCKAPNPDTQKKGKGFTDEKLGLAIGIPIGVVFIGLLVAAAYFYSKRRRESEAEDGVFAVARKPEYGSALVVDDIIQETRGSKTLQAMIDMKDEYDSEEEDDESASESERSHSLSRSRSASHSVSPSRSISRSSFSRGQSSSRVRSAEDSDPGDSASRNSDSD